MRHSYSGCFRFRPVLLVALVFSSFACGWQTQRLDDEAGEHNDRKTRSTAVRQHSSSGHFDVGRGPSELRKNSSAVRSTSKQCGKQNCLKNGPQCPSLLDIDLASPPPADTYPETGYPWNAFLAVAIVSLVCLGTMLFYGFRRSNTQENEDR